MTLVAQRLGYAIEYHVVDSNGLIASVAEGRADLALGCICITEERK